MAKKPSTSWGSSAKWYSDYLETTEDSYQRQVILPNLLRILGPKSGMKVLDIACGQGFFSRAFREAGASVTGADISKELIAEAKKLSPNGIDFHVAPADKLAFAKDGAYDAATVVLAIQNIENMQGAFAEAARILKKGGRIILVMMHPAFRIPEGASWGFDEEAKVQYRRIDRYLSAHRSELLVHPGKKDSPITVSYHRSLQDFSKALFKAGFAITRFEEWISHKESQNGPRKAAEDTSRKEIPLFLMIEARA
jgi:ubiquinone/menaquinone biosynthesis C-methylase UbiE